MGKHNIEMLVRVIRDHGHEAQAQDGRIRVTSWVTQDGNSFQVTEKITATPKSVRNWLGY